MRSRLWPGLISLVAVVVAPHFARADAAVGADRGAGELRVAQIGHSDGWLALQTALREFLHPHRMHPRFEVQPNLSQLDTRGDTAPAVWIELVNQEHARLVLSDAGRDRHLLRDVTLSNGLDEVGRETLAQVIEASLLALQGESPALDRKELERLLWAPPSSSSPADTRPESAVQALVRPPLPPSPARNSARRTDTRSEAKVDTDRDNVRFAPSYLFQWTGTDLGVLHGPGLSLAVQRSLASERWLGAALAYTAHFPQHFTNSQIAFRVQGHDLWLTARLELPLAPALSFVTEAGTGVGWSTATPRRVEGGLTRINPPSTNVALWLRMELGIERRLRAFSVQLSTVTDVAIHDTHYDVTVNGKRTRLVTPWGVVPGARLALAWRY